MRKSIRSACLALLFSLVVPLVSHSAIIEVMNTNDSGPGSLRMAIGNANPAGGDEIVFNPSLEGESILINTPLIIDKSLTITGFGKDELVLENNNTDEETFIVVEDGVGSTNVIIQELEIRNTVDETTVDNAATLTINNARIRGGSTGVLNRDNSVLFINDSIIELCDAGVTNLGASSDIRSPGTAMISRSDINGNVTGIVNTGGSFGSAAGAMLTIYDTVIRNNSSTGILNSGGSFDTTLGGVINMFRTLVVDNDRGISNNSGSFDSGEGAIINAQNSTIANNTLDGIRNVGGGNDDSRGATFNCNFCTIAFNTDDGIENTGGLNGNPAAVDLSNVILAGNGNGTITFNCKNTGDFNISNTSKVTDTSCVIAPVTLPSLELGALQNNGGFTETIALGPTSVALDMVSAAECWDFDMNPLTVDQRQLIRPYNTDCDVGAFELQPVGSITIAKETFPPGVRHIDFSTNNLPASCEMSDSFMLDDGMSVTCPGLAADGTIYAFWESPLQPFSLFDIDCTGNTNGLIPVVAGLGGVRFSLAGGDDVTCTFKNDVFPFNLLGVIPKAAGGKNFILFDGAQPNELVDIYWGFVPQTTELFDDSCPGIYVGIKNPRFLAEAMADGIGDIQFPVFVPGAAAGVTVAIQGVAQENCRVSNVIPVLFTDDN